MKSIDFTNNTLRENYNRPHIIPDKKDNDEHVPPRIEKDLPAREDYAPVQRLLTQSNLLKNIQY